ncbi:MAG: hypothetical protein ACI9R3_006555 [Verrucomicrobiales bacterium]|jgi:hypothetical protein
MQREIPTIRVSGHYGMKVQPTDSLLFDVRARYGDRENQQSPHTTPSSGRRVEGRSIGCLPRGEASKAADDGKKPPPNPESGFSITFRCQCQISNTKAQSPYGSFTVNHSAIAPRFLAQVGTSIEPSYSEASQDFTGLTSTLRSIYDQIEPRGL